MKRRVRNPDTLSLSFLDVISCGLGAAVLLGLVLSISRPGRVLPPTSAPYVRAEFRVYAPNVRVNVVLAPEGLPAADLRLQDFGASGRMLAGRTLPWAGAGEVVVAGLSAFGETDPVTGVDEEGRAYRAFIVFVHNPAPGRWRIDCRLRLAGDDSRLDGSLGREVLVKRDSHVPGQEPSLQSATASFARNLTGFDRIEVPRTGPDNE